MTEIAEVETDHVAAPEPLPLLVTVSGAFNRRLPAQRFLDLIRRLEPGVPFNDLATEQPFRIVAMRALVRDFPNYDTTALWMHAYDVEVDVVDDDPKEPRSLTPEPPSATTGG